MNAKQESTRLRRLELLIRYCENEERIDFMKPLSKKNKIQDRKFSYYP
jgi:hypothetical protein